MVLTVTLNPSVDVWLRATAGTSSAGGKGVNVSRVLRALGERTTALTVAGGETGAAFKRLLRQLHVRHAVVAIRGGTRVNYKICTMRPPATTEINAAGPRLTAPELRAVQRRLVWWLARARCVVFSGSLPDAAPADLYRRWIAHARRRGILAVLDTSGAALRHGLLARPWLVKPNREEAEALLGLRIASMARAIQAVRMLLRRGQGLVVLSLGQDGAMLGRRLTGQVWYARPPAVRVVSSVGSGDALVAGVVTASVRGQPLPEALRYGVACGTASAMRPAGALCRRADVRNVLRGVRLQQLL